MNFLEYTIFCPNILNWLMKWIFWLWLHVDRIVLELNSILVIIFIKLYRWWIVRESSYGDKGLGDW